jgi:hypothetical protein
MRPLLITAGLALAACGVKGPTVDAGIPNAPPAIATSLFANVGVGTEHLLADTSNSRLEFDPTVKDALTALGECADLVSYCYAPPSFDLTACFASARTCTTQQPWTEKPCCPQACKDAFAAEVAKGTAHKDALEKVLFRQPDCFPGVTTLLGAP